ncbi:MAG: dihydroorotase [Halobacteriaceae archaeon]
MLVRDATLADGRRRDVLVRDGNIEAVGEGLDGAPAIDARGRLLLPGMVDAHVHFREPGAPHKETWATGSRSAAAGGVTTVVDQPNTDPPTVTGRAVEEKAGLAARSLVDYGINGGVTPDWEPDSLFAAPVLALGEVFLADSTGEMGIDADLFADAAERAAAAGVTVTVHAEDEQRFDDAARERSDADAWSAFRTAEAEIAAVERALAVGDATGVDLHLAHTSTPEAVDRAAAAGATCEVTPHHLFLSRADLPELGTFGRMNPPLRSAERRAALFERVADGTVDMVATDHAPHTRAEKDASIWDAPSGVPGVETALPLLLAAAGRGELSYERVRDLTAAAPARVFDLPGKGRIEAGRDADLALFDADETTDIRGEQLHSKCGWTPFEGMAGVFPEWTMVRGEVVYASADADLPAAVAPDGEFGAAAGENVRTA